MNSAILSFIKTDRFKKYFFNTGWMFAERSISLIILLTIGILMARYLGPEKFGVLNYAVSICALFSPLCFLGLESITPREIVTRPESEEEILGTTSILLICGCLISISLIAVFSFLTNSDQVTKNLLLIMAAGLIFDSFYVYKYYNQAKVLMKYTAISTLTSVFIASTYKLFLIRYHFDVTWFGVAINVQKAIFAFFIYFFYKKINLTKKRWKFRIKKAKALLNDSWPLLLTSFSVIIYMYIDQAMLMWIKGPAAVGEYAVAVKISEAWYVIPTIICGSIFPAIINAKKNDPSTYQKRLFQLHKLMIIFSVSIAIPVSLLAAPIIKVLFGNPYLLSANVLAIHVWAGIFVFLGISSGCYLIAENFTKISFLRTFLGMLINILLNVILIPYYGINGAALATVISYGIATFSILFYYKTRSHGLIMLQAFLFLKPYKL